jgi:hypothetical protein
MTTPELDKLIACMIILFAFLVLFVVAAVLGGD